MIKYETNEKTNNFFTTALGNQAAFCTSVSVLQFFIPKNHRGTEFSFSKQLLHLKEAALTVERQGERQICRYYMDKLTPVLSWNCFLSVYSAGGSCLTERVICVKQSLTSS